jgi:molybdenum cofactor biosynthesis enzyme MoaA
MRLTPMSHPELTDVIAPLRKGPIEEHSSSIQKGDGAPPRPDLGQPKFRDILSDLTLAEARNDIIPGRGDLRISLTSACNLKCSYCHNEGQEAPWLHQNKTSAMLGSIQELLEMAVKYGVKSVKFSGGEPGVYPGFFGLMDAIADWRDQYPSIKKWGMNTNGVPFLNSKKFEALVASGLDNLSVGIDSVELGEPSKPSSPVGVAGKKLIEEFVIPLVQRWTGRSIKLDTVFTGDKLRTLNVIRTARRLDINVSVIEINGVMGAAYTVRKGFLELIGETAEEYRLQSKLYEPLNEIYLYDEQNNTPVKFYPDHCQDLNCANCRKLHLRVSPTPEGWGAVPCFLRAQSKTIPLMMDGKLSDARFKDAIRYNGQGPQWFKDTLYDQPR